MQKHNTFNSVQDAESAQLESGRRRKAVGSAIVSFQLEGIEPTPEFLALAERFISLEIDRKEFRTLAKQL